MTKLLRSTRLVGWALAALTAVAPAVAQGQGAVITGRVQSEQGQALVGANVQIAELNISIGTSESGAFSITVPAARVRTAPVVLRVRAIGYVPETRQVSLTAGNQNFNFSLKKDVTQLSDVVVTGVTAATEAVKLPFTVAQINEKDMPGSRLESSRAAPRGKVPGAMIVSATGRPGLLTVRSSSRTCVAPRDGSQQQPWICRWRPAQGYWLTNPNTRDAKPEGAPR